MFYIWYAPHYTHTPNNFRYLFRVFAVAALYSKLFRSMRSTHGLVFAVRMCVPFASAFVNEMQTQTYFVSYTFDWLKINQFFKYEP